MLIRRLAMLILGLVTASAACAGEIIVHALTVEKILFNSNTAANAGHRGQVFIKVNRNIYDINPGCAAANWYTQEGYLVAVFNDDPYAKQNIAGLLTAKATGQTITAAVDDTRKNVSGICALSWFEIE